MKPREITRREFLRTSAGIAAGAVVASLPLPEFVKGSKVSFAAERPVVSIVKIERDNMGIAVEKAIDLIGGIERVAAGKDRIMLKPNLVNAMTTATTKREVVKALAQTMRRAGKEVVIGEGSAAANKFNVDPVTKVVYRTKKRELIDHMQQYIFDQLGYTDLSLSMGLPLINLHSGDFAEAEVPNGFVFDKIILHRSLTEIDLLCSVPMMKTHALAAVTLGMKNLVGLFPGPIYYAPRAYMHDIAVRAESSAAAACVIDMMRANKLGLVVVDASTAMEGQGPSSGTLVKMDLIIAGTNPVATDMVAAAVMGIGAEEVPTFAWANKAGMGPTSLEDIEVRGERLEGVKRTFARPKIYTWESISKTWAYQEIV